MFAKFARPEYEMNVSVKNAAWPVKGPKPSVFASVKVVDMPNMIVGVFVIYVIGQLTLRCVIVTHVRSAS